MGNPRISATNTALVEELASRHGFTTLHPHELDFRAQAEALFNAECVVGVHGAGFTNILFGPSSLRVLELNLRLDGETLPRPWFYVLAHGRRQRYMMLDSDAGDLTRDRLQAVIGMLCDHMHLVGRLFLQSSVQARPRSRHPTGERMPRAVESREC